jgi:Bacterial regulatory helix-turn-helix protein, lysR family
MSSNVPNVPSNCAQAAYLPIAYGDASTSLRGGCRAERELFPCRRAMPRSQPSLSQQIQKLEDELGERLFDRMKRVAKLTPHGETFLPHAVRILEEVEVAKREAVDAQLLRDRTNGPEYRSLRSPQPSREIIAV